jgi:NADH-quinone oxidoreductase subunit N
MTLLEQLQDIIRSFSGFVAELQLAGLFILLVLADLLAGKRVAWLLPVLTASGLAVVALTVAGAGTIVAEQTLFLGMLSGQALYAGAFKLIFLLSALVATGMAAFYRPYQYQKPAGSEFYGVLVALVLGLHLISMANNLLMVYLSLELVSICAYILVGQGPAKKGAEAGIKYILFGAMASGIMLYGISLLYGFTGSLDITVLAQLNLADTAQSLAATLAIIFMLAGILFKLGAVPMHIWVPDAYEGGPTPVIAFLSVAPKAAAIALLIRLLQGVSYEFLQIGVYPFLILVAILSIFIGNLAALRQTITRRMLAYSSIAHTGFLLIGVIALSQSGLQAILFYLFVYLLMNMAAFVLVQWVAEYKGREDLEAFKGLGLLYPFLGVIAIILMIALTGLPPTGGFSAKLFIFSAVWEAYELKGDTSLLILFIVGLANTVLALFYYLRIPFYMFFRKEEDAGLQVRLVYKLLLIGLTLPVLLLFFQPQWILDWIGT